VEGSGDDAGLSVVRPHLVRFNMWSVERVWSAAKKLTLLRGL
jgi:hypothetical protein